MERKDVVLVDEQDEHSKKEASDGFNKEDVEIDIEKAEEAGEKEPEEPEEKKKSPPYVRNSLLWLL